MASSDDVIAFDSVTINSSGFISNSSISVIGTASFFVMLGKCSRTKTIMVAE